MVAELWWHVKMGGQATHFHKNMPLLLCETVVSVGTISRWSVDDFSRWFQFVVSVASQSVKSADVYIRAINLLCFVELTVGATLLGEPLGCHA